MRYIIALIIVVCTATWFIFFHPVKRMVDYPVKVNTGLQADDVKYRVPLVSSFLGADLYREKGYFVKKLGGNAENNDSNRSRKFSKMKLPEGLIKSNIYLKISDADMQTYAPRPEYGFWLQYGRWIMLFIFLIIIYLIIRRK